MLIAVIKNKPCESFLNPSGEHCNCSNFTCPRCGCASCCHCGKSKLTDGLWRGEPIKPCEDCFEDLEITYEQKG